MGKKRKCLYSFLAERFVYTTKKELRVQNPFIATINILGLLLVVTYVVVYTIYLDKGYQMVGYPTGYVSTKVKGVAFNATENFDEYSFFESVELTRPALAMDGLFLTTAMVQTWQSRGICDGEDECDHDDNCTLYGTDYNGINTGECSDGYCQQYRWCPGENDTIIEENKIIGVENFTIFLKIALNFEDFDVSLINTEDKLGTGALIEGYNLFTVSDILDECELDIDDIIEDGALINGNIYYDCNFDEGDDCGDYPQFTFTQEDTDEDSVSTGFNFRQAYFSLDSNRTTDRLLVKYHGIWIRFNIQGKGGKFTFAAFSVTLGSGIALTAISAFVTEFLLRHCIPERSFYSNKRMEVVTLEEEEEWQRTRTLDEGEIDGIRGINSHHQEEVCLTKLASGEDSWEESKIERITHNSIKF